MNDNPLDELGQDEWDKFIFNIIKPYMFICYANSHLSVEDLQQEAWHSLLRVCEVYDPQKGKLTTFAYKTIKGNVLRYIKKQTKLSLVNFEDEISVSDPHDEEQTIEDRDVYEMIFNKLSDQEHAGLLVDKYIYDMPLRELATKYGVSHQTIKNRLTRLRETLETRMKS